MLPVLCFGEALIDCLQTGQTEVDGLSLPQFTHFPGGAPANVAVAVAKLGGQAYFGGQVGKDSFGDFLKSSMERYGVNTSQMHQHSEAPTALAFVLLDSEGERSFSFYRNETADLLYAPGQMNLQAFSTPGILHLCSNTLATDAITKTTLAIVQNAKELGWKISFDVNFRHNLWADPDLAPGRIGSLIEAADVIKASGEEINMLFPGQDLHSLIQKWRQNRFIVITDGGEAVNSYSDETSHRFEVPKVKVVDTTSAGDSFVGGLLYQLSLLDIWSSETLEKAVSFAIRCGAITVTRPGAYPALPWANEITDVD